MASVAKCCENPGCKRFPQQWNFLDRFFSQVAVKDVGYGWQKLDSICIYRFWTNHDLHIVSIDWYLYLHRFKWEHHGLSIFWKSIFIYYCIYRSLGDLEFIPQIWIPMTHPSTFPRPICQPLENMAARSFQRCFTRASCDTKKARGPLQRYDLEVGYVKMAKEWHSFTMSLKNIPRYIHNMCIYVYTDIYIYTYI